MRSHTCGFMTMGTGGECVNYSKQNLDTKSSTEADLVGVDNAPNQVIWTLYFLKDQGYQIYNNIIYQDNQRSIKIQKNGRRSSSKRTRQINARYYFITDRITKRQESVELCPTLDMIGDYFTKALQGSQFRIFRSIIIGIHKDDIPAYNPSRRALHEERKMKLKKNKEEAQKSAKLTVDQVNQGVCLEKYINGSLLADY